jgi:hypothetical protein
MELIKKISDELNLPQQMLTEALLMSRKYVKHLKIKKRDGTLRTVYQPSKKLKIIQYWLIEHIFKDFKVHPAATAFLKGTSIKTNVDRHKKGRYFLKLDFKDFFPSIHFTDLEPILHNCAKVTNQEIKVDELLQIVRDSCFYVNNLLPIGYPTSPLISNIVMYEFDSKIITALSDDDKYGKSCYTRYADDLTFSTNVKGACNNIQRLVEEVLNNMTSPKLKPNPTKTRFVTSSGGSAIVTGLRICHDGHMTIHRDYKDKVRLMISLYNKGLLSGNDILSLKGHLSYVRYVDGAFYTKLQKKHFKSINKILTPDETDSDKA